jgi:hypothetical protein
MGLHENRKGRTNKPQAYKTSCPMRGRNGLVQCFFQSLARFKFGDSRRGYLDCGTGLGISARTGFPLVDIEGSKTDKADSLTLFQIGGNTVEKGFQSTPGLGLGNLRVLGHPFNNLFLHLTPLLSLVWWLSLSSVPEVYNKNTMVVNKEMPEKSTFCGILGFF